MNENVCEFSTVAGVQGMYLGPLMHEMSARTLSTDGGPLNEVIDPLPGATYECRRKM